MYDVRLHATQIANIISTSTSKITVESAIAPNIPPGACASLNCIIRMSRKIFPDIQPFPYELEECILVSVGVCWSRTTALSGAWSDDDIR